MLQENEYPIDKISGVGSKYRSALQRLNIISTTDLIYFLPKKVIDVTDLVDISRAKSQIGHEVIMHCELKSLAITRSKIKKIWIVEGLLEDESGNIRAIWYNQPYLYKSLKRGKKFVFKGIVNSSGNSIYLNNPEIFDSPGLYPVYRQTKNLSSKIIGNIARKIIKLKIMPQERLPEKIKKKYKLPDIKKAFEFCHNPKTLTEFQRGKERFLFEEIFYFILTNLLIKKEFYQNKSPEIRVGYSSRLIGKLPFRLTKDQLNAFLDIEKDLSKKYPMNRLIQGDVGSGKTIVAFLAALEVAMSSYEVAFIAPTQILANQHFQTFEGLIKRLNLKINLNLVSSKIKTIRGEGIFIGTHALLNHEFKNLGLVIVDEQQRFGVEQRTQLVESKDYMPHYLSLSATPIPRTLSQIIFSNCDLSIIREKPKNRKKIKTYLIPQSRRQDTYNFISAEIQKGRQVFIICPVIDQDVLNEKKSINQELISIKRTLLRQYRIGLLHGRLEAQEKERVMKRFQSHKIDILIATSVVEVGIDVSNASVVLIENADMFGLAQLHQFRGRVGRGDYQSYCFVFTEKISVPNTQERLKAFIRNDDGFELANLDLKLRGPGAIFDYDQSGYNSLNPLWFRNSEILKQATDSAKETIGESDLNKDLLEYLRSKITIKHMN